MQVEHQVIEVHVVGKEEVLKLTWHSDAAFLSNSTSIKLDDVPFVSYGDDVVHVTVVSEARRNESTGSHLGTVKVIARITPMTIGSDL